MIAETFSLHQGDSLEVMKPFSDNSIDTIITDPPYGLKFMNKTWDHGVPGIPYWKEALRVAKPVAMLLAFGGTRTYHRLTCAIEDAGWEIRDCIMWLYGSGMPKSHNVALSIDKMQGMSDRGHRIATASRNHPDGTFEPNGELLPAYEARTPQAEPWVGFGTGLKPAVEPIVVAMKPIEGTYAKNALHYGVAGFNIDEARIPFEEGGNIASNPSLRTHINGGNGGKIFPAESDRRVVIPNEAGRWPANIIMDEDAAAALDLQTGILKSGEPSGMKAGGQKNVYGHFNGGIPVTGYGDEGGASRFFYVAKASNEERGEYNTHPTVKPLELMRYLCRLTKTPKGGKVLDLFMGSGTTGIATLWEGREFIGIDIEEQNVEIADRRIRESIKRRKQTESLNLFPENENV